MSFDFLMTDHPAWQSDGSCFHRLLSVGSGETWLVKVEGRQLSWRALRGDDPAPPIDVYVPPTLVSAPAASLHVAVARLGAVARLRNPSLWDALATAIIRQVIRAAQARKLYRAFCARYGSCLALSDGMDIHSFPSPERVLALSDAEFAESGMAFKRRPLRRAAEAFLAHRSAWADLSPAVLVKELQTVPGIGPWSAGAAVADWSNDWTLYPYGDLAVRAWARHADPDRSWPSDEPSFARMWRQVTGEHLGTYTLLTLALGCQRSGTV